MRKENRVLKKIVILAITAALILSCCSCAGTSAGSDNGYANYEVEIKELSDGKMQVTDGAGRNVTMDSEITRIAPSGATATMFLITIAPEMLVGLASSPSRAQRDYLPEYLWYLPTFGQFYGAKSTLNMEALIAEEPQLVIDVGDRKATIKSDMDMIQSQTKIPTVFFEADIEHMASAYRNIGKILGKEEEAEAMAQFIDKTVEMAKEKSAQIAEEDKVTIMYGTGSTGLSVNAEESSQAQVIEIIGAKNAVVTKTVTSSGGGTILSMEGVYDIEPDVVVLSAGGPYDSMETNEWSDLQAVKNGKYYEIPNLPYNWLSSPPSVNMGAPIHILDHRHTK